MPRATPTRTSGCSARKPSLGVRVWPIMSCIIGWTIHRKTSPSHLGTKRRHVDGGAAELLQAGRRALHAGHLDIEALGLPVSQRDRQGGVRGVTDGDVLRGHGEDHLPERLVVLRGNDPGSDEAE